MDTMKTNTLTLIAALALSLVACGGAQDGDDTTGTGDDVQGSPGGKADNADETGTRVLARCSGGAFVLEQTGTTFLATVTDPDVLAEIELNSTGTACSEGPSGGSGCVTKRLPWQAELGDGVFTLELTNGSADEMSFSTSYPGSTVKQEGEGIRMVLRNAELANSHMEVRYEISSHLFDACEFPTDPTDPEGPGEPEEPNLGENVVAFCDEGALVVESDGTKFKAVVNDPNIVAYIEEQSKGTACAQDGGGCVTKHLPWEATIENGVLTLTGLNGSAETMSFITSYPGSTVKKEGEGMKLELRSSQLASSHVEVRYEIANWFFASCTFR
jgi:hypothetical protein